MHFSVGISCYRGVAAIVATVGGAYYHDSTLPSADRTASRLVNWEQVGGLARWGVDRAQDEFKRLTAR